MKKIVCLITVFMLSACSSPQKTEQIGDVETLYNRGMDSMEKKDFFSAVNTFEELERQHPYSGWATRAEMMVIYAHYRQRNYDEVVMLADKFIRTHPGHKDLDYVFYLKGMSAYSRIRDVKRDQANTLEALSTFEELRYRFPQSEYAKDARLKISLCRDHLAGQEMLIGRFYQDKKRYMAAINRYKHVVEKYETTTHTPEALYRLTESYMALGVHREAQMSAAVLGHNYPASSWYKDAYGLLKEKDLTPATEVEEDSWYRKVYQGVKEVF